MKDEKVMEMMLRFVKYLVEKENKENDSEYMKFRTVNLPILPEPSDIAPINLIPSLLCENCLMHVSMWQFKNVLLPHIPAYP